MSGRVGSITTDILADGLFFNMDPSNRASTIPSSNTTKTFNTIKTSVSGSVQCDFVKDNPLSYWQFDGVDDYIELTNSTDLNINASGGKVTLACWTQIGSTVNGFAATVVGRKHVGATAPYKIRSYGSAATSTIAMQILDSTHRGGPTLTPGSTFDLNTWVYLVFTYDYSNSSARFNNYVNGQFINSSTTGGGNITDNTNGFEMMRSAADNSFRSGLIGAVHIYNRALSANEVLHNYNALKGRFGL